MNKDKEALVARILRKKNNDKGGGSKKYGRNAIKCKYYREARSLKNKLAKLKKHRSAHPNDMCVVAAYERLFTK